MPRIYPFINTYREETNFIVILPGYRKLRVGELIEGKVMFWDVRDKCFSGLSILDEDDLEEGERVKNNRNSFYIIPK